MSKKTATDIASVKKIAGTSPPEYFVTVPVGVIAGQKFPAVIEGKKIFVTCPPKASAGHRVRIRMEGEAKPVASKPCSTASLPIPKNETNNQSILDSDLKVRVFRDSKQ